ncbi:hypothetical protein [Bacillus cereus]|uniref:hypothetical protein n=1 Tax=Bacillus cereus TaxID=1396 RepID=UPI000BF5746F|nr:hypothetical protein [Bacillus cereus]PEQ47968.1 hypothetical protein CN469_31255 [Bacillus cereus]
MKKNIRKMKKVFSFAMLIGLLVTGGNSISADSQQPLYGSEYLKDENGNPLDEHEAFYLEPINVSDSGVVSNEWNGRQWTSLGSKSDHKLVSFKYRSIVK